MEDKVYKILVVDDDKDIVEMLKSKLTREQYEVVVAYDGKQALRKVSKEDPDIILLDLMLPKKNGFEVLQDIRQKHNERWRPVIIVSARTEIESFKKGYSLQADHYITKPCNFEDILRGIRTMISLMPHRIT
ncbi:MAG: response regulator [Candidatus Omnitrophica bacterium]|nr:response regulator [Candidatus Omnitrophota bacterium]